MFKSVFPKFNKESFGQRLEKVPKEFHKYMVEQQRFIRLRQSAEAILKRKKPLLEEMVSKVHDHERKNMDVYVLHDSTLPRDLVIIFRHDTIRTKPRLDDRRKKNMILILLNSQFGTSPILERHSKKVMNQYFPI